jgi:hypothetical protein
MLFGENMVSVPPYCGVPSLSHQFPAEPAEVVVGLADDIVAWIVVEVVVLAIVGAVVDVVAGIDIEVEVEHEAKIIDITMRQVKAIQVIPLFI